MLRNYPGLREGTPFVIFFLFLCLLAALLSSIFKHYAFACLSIVFFMLTLFTLYFFRDPDRAREQVGKGNDLREVLSPADGRVLDVIEIFEPRYLHYPAKRVSIFMSIFNVHVNRSPVEGKIEYLHYNPGKFMSAFKEKASLDNEQISIGVIKKSQGEPDKKLLFTLIAGLIARRIVLWKKESDQVKKGERIGMIRFGSRVDLYLPREAEVMIKKGQHVMAGKTVIGYW